MFSVVLLRWPAELRILSGWVLRPFCTAPYVSRAFCLHAGSEVTAEFFSFHGIQISCLLQ